MGREISAGTEQVGVWQQTVVCFIFRPLFFRRKDSILPRFLLQYKEKYQLLLNSACVMWKTLWAWLAKAINSGAHRFPPVPKTAELTPRIYYNLFNSENKFMGGQSSSCIQLLTDTLFSKCPICFFGHWALHCSSYKGSKCVRG